MNKIKLIQGDCLEVLPKLKSEDIKVNAVIADIPYSITANKWDISIPFDKMWSSLYPLIHRDTAIVLFGTEPFASKLRLSNEKDYLYDWIWEKPNGANFLQVKYRPFKVHEHIIVFSQVRKPIYNPQFTKGEPYKKRSGERQSSNFRSFKPRYNIDNPTGKRYPRSIQKFDNCKRGNMYQKSSNLHPTEKPIELMEYLVKTYSNEGDTVLDFTMGCGSTALACIKNNRQFIGIELDETYFKSSVNRVYEAVNDTHTVEVLYE